MSEKGGREGRRGREGGGRETVGEGRKKGGKERKKSKENSLRKNTFIKFSLSSNKTFLRVVMSLYLSFYR